MPRSQSDYLQTIVHRSSTPSATQLPSLNSTPALQESADAADQPSPDRGEGSSSTTIPASDPCERCVRAGRTCRGPSGSRCEHCKRLKQKCSNSSISLRGKHAARAAAVAATTYTERAAPIDSQRSHQPDSAPSPPPSLGKRKDRDDTPSENTTCSTVVDEEVNPDKCVVPARQDKKRRIQVEVERRNAIVATKVMKHVEELEECFKRLQESYACETANFRSIMSVIEEEMAQYLPDDNGATVKSSPFY